MLCFVCGLSWQSLTPTPFLLCVSTAGSYTVSFGAGRCIDCEPGSFTPSNASLGCQTCGVGRFARVYGASTCDEVSVLPGFGSCL
jgi:hypothetical protein